MEDREPYITGGSKMKEYKGLQIPKMDEVLDTQPSIYDIQDAHCNRVSEADCPAGAGCEPCLFFSRNIDDFTKWYNGEK